MSARKFWWWLAAITGAALAVRLAYVYGWRQDVVFGGDSRFYHEGANLLADGHGFLNPFTWHDLLRSGASQHSAERLAQSANHPPLYWAYLGIVSSLGFRTVLEHLVWSTFLGAGTVLATGMAGRAIAGARAGLIAAALAAVAPNVWSWDGMILSETMALLTVTLTVWAAYRFWHSPSTGNAVLMGALVALAMLSRAELALLALLVVVPLVLRDRTVDVGARVVRLVAAGATAAVIVAPWVGFNLVRFENPVTLSTGFEITALAANCEQTYHGRFIGYWTQACPLEVRDEIPAGLDESQEVTYFRRAAVDFVEEHKGDVPRVVLARLGRITHLFRPWQQSTLDWFPEGRPLGVARAGLYSYFVVVPFALGAVFLLRRRRVPALPVCAPIVLVWITTAITFGQVRYRAPAETAFLLLAAVTVDALISRGANHRTPTSTS